MLSRLRRLLCLCCLSALIALPLSAVAEASALWGYVSRQGWQYVTLGRYRQAADGGVEPIVWRVLRVEDGRAYAVSEYILINHRIHPDDKEYVAFGGDFRQTEMWAFLNGEFAGEAFTEDELAALEDTEAYGRLFLLSRQDLNDKSIGFGTNRSRKAWGTPWALAQMTHNEAHNNRVEQALFRYGSSYGSHSPYWTLTQSTHTYAANCTKQEGQIGYIDVMVQNEGCRPACMILLGAVTAADGDGTLERPFALVPVQPAEAPAAAVDVIAEPIVPDEPASEGDAAF